MQIDRSNYEIWLIDWLDGNLDDIETHQVQLFLRENPDIREEYNELQIFRLRSSGESFHNKYNLKRTTAALPESQFEYLCVAFLENDLSSEQITELNEIIEKDPGKRRTFDLIRKTKLSRIEGSFKHKKRLLRRTFAQNFIRISAIGLSAAAITALLILINVLKPGPLPVRLENTAQSVVPPNSLPVPPVKKVQEKKQPEEKNIRVKKTNAHLPAISIRETIAANLPNLIVSSQPDSILHGSDTLNSSIRKVPVSFSAYLKMDPLPSILIELNQKVVVPPNDDGRSKLSRFIARTVREKILKEKTAKDNPLKGYEIAEAGVTGLNKLLGWEMALDERKNENGELQSVYFSSKILKFNAPVKKSLPHQ